MALRLTSINRWCVSGTPVQRGLEGKRSLRLSLNEMELVSTVPVSVTDLEMINRFVWTCFVSGSRPILGEVLVGAVAI